MRIGWKGLIPILAALDNLPPLLSPFSSSASVPVSSFPTTTEAGEGRGGGGSVVPVGGKSRRYATPSTVGDAQVREGVSGGDTAQTRKTTTATTAGEN